MYSKFFDIKKIRSQKPVFPKPSLSPKKTNPHSSSQTHTRKPNNYFAHSKEIQKLRTPSSKITSNYNSTRNLYKKPRDIGNRIPTTKNKPGFLKDLKAKLANISQREFPSSKKTSNNSSQIMSKQNSKREKTYKGRSLKTFGSSRKSAGLKYYKTKEANSKHSDYDLSKKIKAYTNKTSSHNFIKNKTKSNVDLELKIAKAFFKQVKKNNIIAINKFYQDFQKMTAMKRERFSFDLADDEGCRLAHYAVWHNNVQLFQFLLKNKVSFDVSNKDEITPFMLGALKGHSKLAALLINITADANKQDKAGNTALHYAVVKERLEVLKTLLRNPHIDETIKNKDGHTAVDLAHPRIVVKLQELLLKRRDEHYVGRRELQIYGPEEDFVKPAKHLIFSTKIENEKKTENKIVGLDDFVVHSKIGEGSFGEVYLVEKKDTGTFGAMKVLAKQKIMADNLKRYALTERNVLSTIDHPFIVKLRFAFQNSQNLFLIMDYCPGGDLGEYLEEESRFAERRTKIYIAEVILALEELHKNNIIFRDLKPENIILDNNGHAMLIDFGLSKENVCAQNKGARSFCGSVAYLAPEMVKKTGHGKAMDWYLLGVVMYEFLVGLPPFYADTKEELFHNIEHGKLKIPNFVSSTAKDLLVGLLQRSPHKRLGYSKGAEEIKRHPWFFGVNWDEVMQRKLRPPKPVVRRMRLFELDPQPRFESRRKERMNSVDGWTFVEPEETKKE